MKKNKSFWACVCLFVILISLCSCSSSATKYTVEKNRVLYEINRENTTISDGNYVYKYNLRPTGSDYSLTITYPDGSTYHQTKNGYSVTGGWSEDYNPEIYTSGDVLSDILSSHAHKSSGHGPGKTFSIIFLFILGIFNILSPKAAWFIEYGWRFKNAEPSDIALLFNRLSGVAAIIAGIVLLFT